MKCDFTQNPRSMILLGGCQKAMKMVMMVAFLLFANGQLFAQGGAVTVTGKVTDQSGAGLPGVTVLLKGTTTAAPTGIDGGYSIMVPNGNGTLVFSFIGYQAQEVSLNGRTSVNVSLALDQQLVDEIVVVGYGTQKKSDVTGAVASIKGDALREVPTANVVQALQGRVAGLDIARTGSRPGAGGQIRIRGNRSLNAGNDPLIVIDGIPYGGSINDLNTDDVASIDVLKDASATAIYGSRGANGVILITTKRGEEGKPRLSYNAYYGIAKPFGKYDLMNAQEFVAFRNLAQYTAGYSPMELKGIQNGTDTDWLDVALQTGYVTNHELGISGGSEGLTYGVSAGYFKEEGILPGQSFERFSLRNTIDAKIGKRIRVGFNNMNTLSYTNGEGLSPMYNIARITPLAPVYNEDGSINKFPMEGTVDQTATMNPLTLRDSDAIVDRRRRLRTFNSIYGEVSIIDGLKYRLNMGLDFRHDQRGTYTGPNTILNPAATTTAGARATLENGESYTATFENLLIYEKTFAEKHRLTFTGLYSVQIDQSNASSMNGNNFPSEAVQYYNFTLANTQTIAGGGYTKGGLMSFMGRVNYAFNDRYLLTATFRRDGSNVFPVNKFISYPALSLGWNISNEDFMSNLEAISLLKLRAGYGVTGNPGIPANATRGSLARNRYNYGSDNVFGYFISSLPNLDLRWEATKQYNVGVDFGFLNNRITGSLEVYKQNTDNLLVRKDLPRSNGVDNYWTNAANTQNKGIEFNLSTVNVETAGGFSWTSDFNFSLNREKIVRLEEETTKQNVGNGWFVGQPVNVIYDYTKLGIWQLDEAEAAAKFNAKPGQIKLADISGPDGVPDGIINDLDRSVVGTFQPDWIGGTTQRFAYKNFDLSFVLFARMGGTLVATYLQNDGSGTGYFGFGNSRSNQVNVDYWTPNNPTNSFPLPTASSDRIPYSSTLGYHDASFIKVRSINFGYTLPSTLINRIGMSSARIYVTAQNPFLLYSPFIRSGLGFDPEGTGTGGAVQSQGSSAGVTDRAITVGLTTPSTRQFMVGVNVKF
ncbi:SusC/RagA family TonB-linked outer membrane protein [Rufibacter ruber]|uniref:SusC/RagA family TonB-linked outer membrane protein n=1 Tax=Rufibacter ruber TaxID=1783499 RepID=UPI000836D7E3|nr:TonB-dependent receptor [Rufibacter ruber]